MWGHLTQLDPGLRQDRGVCLRPGGNLTHAAIVSREYRIPTETGCAVATQALKDGDLIEVDGDTGTVRILERA